MRVSGLDFRSCYWDDEQARASHKRFLKSIHELDLQRWQDAGCWDKEHYLPYSLFDKTGGIVSTVCVFLMDLVVGGRELRVGQFSGVGTAPEWRRRGLGDWLSRRAMSELSTHVHGYYLFADQGAVPFYQQMGFVAVSEQRPICTIAGRVPRPGARRLDLSRAADLELLRRLAPRRQPVSEVLGSRTPSLFLFHCLYTMADCAWLLPGGEVVFARRKGARLEVLDIAAERVPAASEWLPWLQDPTLEQVCFHFMPDRMGLSVSGWDEIAGGGCHCLAPFTMPCTPGLFPFSAHA